MSKILQKLRGGDLRSIGRAEEVVQDILKNLVGTGSPAMKNRGNKLINKLKGL